MKKFRSILMICIFAALFTVKSPVYAAAYYGDFQYEESEDSVAIYSYNGADKEVSIPAYIKDKPVTEIKDYAFLLCNSVEKVIVPSTVKTIEANAFSGASNLKEVVLASEDTKIETNEEAKEQGNQEESNVQGNREESNAQGTQEVTDAQGEQEKSDAQGEQEESVTGNADNPKTGNGTLDNNKPNYEVSVDPKVDTEDNGKTGTNGKETNNNGISGTNDEIAGIDEGIDEDIDNESENNPDSIEENTNISSDTGKNENTIEQDNGKSGRTMIWLVAGGVLVIGAGIGFVIWRKKRK